MLNPRRDGIVQWVKRKTGPFATTIDTPEQLKEFESGQDAVVLAYFKELSPADAAYAAFVAAAQAVNVEIAQTTDPAVAKAAELSLGSVAVIKHFEVRTSVEQVHGRHRSAGGINLLHKS